jgi:hypothetical protein
LSFSYPGKPENPRKFSRRPDFSVPLANFVQKIIFEPVGLEIPKKFAGFQPRRCKQVKRPMPGAQTEQTRINIMKSFNRICRPVVGAVVLAAAFAAVSSISRAGDTNSAASKPVPYPLDTCIISGDKLGGDMGGPVVFVYTNNGANQEIKFCCPMCKPKFLADPDKYMKTIHAAEAKAKAKN